MKKLFFTLIALFVLTTAFSETSFDKYPKRPKSSSSGFNYQKHYRKQHRAKFFDKLFDRNHCNHYRQHGW
jgi:hypothetical protein